MIFPRSIRDVAVLLVDLIAVPVGWAIDRLNLDNLTEDDE